MRNEDMKQTRLKDFLLKTAFVAAFSLVASCIGWPPIPCVSMQDSHLSEQINKGYIQTKRWLALRVAGNIVLVCRDEDVEKWSIPQQNGRWTVVSIEEKPKQSTVDKALSKQPPILANLLNNISNPEETFSKHGDWAIIQADNIWKALPACTLIGYGDNNFIFWEAASGCDHYLSFFNMLHINFVVLAEESTFSELLAALNKRGEKVMMHQARADKSKVVNEKQ